MRTDFSGLERAVGVTAVFGGAGLAVDLFLKGRRRKSRQKEELKDSLAVLACKLTEKEEHIRAVQAYADSASKAEAEAKRQLCASQQTAAEQAAQLQEYVGERALIQQEVLKEQQEPACLVAEVKSKVKQLSDAIDKRNQVAKELHRQACVNKMVQKQLSAEGLKTQAWVLVTQHLAGVAEVGEAEVCSLRTANLDLRNVLRDRDAELSSLKRTMEELRCRLAPEVKEQEYEAAESAAGMQEPSGPVAEVLATDLANHAGLGPPAAKQTTSAQPCKMCKADEPAASAVASGGTEETQAAATDLESPAIPEATPPAAVDQLPSPPCQVNALSVTGDQGCLQAPAAAPSHEAAGLAELPFHLEDCVPAPVCCSHLSTRQVQEVQNHLQECIPAQPWLPADMHWQLSCKAIARHWGVDPQLVYVRPRVMGSGGGGVVSLARYRPRKRQRYDCALKQIKRHAGQSVEELAASADHEFGQMWEAWSRGVAHTVEPLGVYHSQPQQAPRGFGMYDSKAPAPPPAESFILMRLAEGVDAHIISSWLHDKLPNGLRLTPGQVEYVALRFAKSMLQGLSELHCAGLAIADVKLANAVVDPRMLQGGLGPFAKLIDYGLSTQAAGSAGGGTPKYMPMEQLNSYMHPSYLPPNHHQGLADVYSLGISLWSMLVGRDPLRRVLRSTHPGLDHKSRKADLLRFQLKQDLSLHFGDASSKAAVGKAFEEDMAPYTQGVQELVTSMLQHVLYRQSADQLLQRPILRQLPSL